MTAFEIQESGNPTADVTFYNKVPSVYPETKVPVATLTLKEGVTSVDVVTNDVIDVLDYVNVSAGYLDKVFGVAPNPDIMEAVAGSLTKFKCVKRRDNPGTTKINVQLSTPTEILIVPLTINYNQSANGGNNADNGNDNSEEVGGDDSDDEGDEVDEGGNDTPSGGAVLLTPNSSTNIELTVTKTGDHYNIKYKDGTPIITGASSVVVEWKYNGKETPNLRVQSWGDAFGGGNITVTGDSSVTLDSSDLDICVSHNGVLELQIANANVKFYLKKQ